MDRPDQVALSDPGEANVAPGDPPEDGVLAIEVGLHAEVDEPLAPAGIGARKGHAEHWQGVALAIDLVAD